MAARVDSSRGSVIEQYVSTPHPKLDGVATAFGVKKLAPNQAMRTNNQAWDLFITAREELMEGSRIGVRTNKMRGIVSSGSSSTAGSATERAASSMSEVLRLRAAHPWRVAEERRRGLQVLEASQDGTTYDQPIALDY
jgi:hypothetical protein